MENRTTLMVARSRAEAHKGEARERLATRGADSQRVRIGLYAEW